MIDGAEASMDKGCGFGSIFVAASYWVLHSMVLWQNCRELFEIEVRLLRFLPSCI